MNKPVDQINDSRRKFIKVAAAGVYVSPLVLSMNVKASTATHGSTCYAVGNGRYACE